MARALNFMGAFRSIDYPPTDHDNWVLVNNTATELCPVKKANAHAVFITVEDQPIRYCIDGSTASGDYNTVASGGHIGHIVAAAGNLTITDPTGVAIDNLSMVNQTSGALPTLQITYY